MNLLGNMAGVNPLAIGAAAIASAVLGALWFAAAVPRRYNLALGRDAGERRPMPVAYLLGPFVCSLASALTTATLMRMLPIGGLADAALLGALVGAGYVVATSVNTAINPNMPHPFMYGLVCAPYFLVNSIVGAMLIAAIG